METKDVVTFHQNDLPAASFTAFEDMRKKGQFCDLTITIENLIFTVHRVIVSAAIPYFRSLLTASSITTDEKEISLVDLEPRALESLIHFAYTSKIIISSENAHSLLVASQFLQLDQVRDACAKFLSERLSVSNVVQVRTLAQSLNDSNLVEISDRYIRNNFEEFSESGDFLSLPGSRVKEIISEDDLNVSDEEIVFEAVLRWVKDSPPERLDVLPGLFSEVRVVNLTDHYLIKRVESEELIRTSVPCRDLINEVKNHRLLPTERSLFSNLQLKPRKCAGNKESLYAACRCGTSELSVYSCDLVNGMWSKLPSKQPQDDFRCSVTIVNDNIYIIQKKKILIFHVKTQEWEFIRPGHENIHGAATVPHGSMIYCFGSWETHSADKVHCFDTQQSKWLKERKMRTDRHYSAAASRCGLIYVTGGYRIPLVYSLSEKYNPSTDQWSEIASMLTPRFRHACTTVNWKIYACGGWTSSRRYLRSAEVYDPLTNHWTSVSPMNTGRELFSLLSGNKKIYAFGGAEDEFAVEAEIYDPENDQWKCGFRVPEGLLGAVLITSHP